MKDVPNSIVTARLGITHNNALTHKYPRWTGNRIKTCLVRDCFVAAISPGSREGLERCCHFGGQNSFDNMLGPSSESQALYIGWMG